jgi:hypothetical protein
MLGITYLTLNIFRTTTMYIVYYIAHYTNLNMHIHTYHVIKYKLTHTYSTETTFFSIRVYNSALISKHSNTLTTLPKLVDVLVMSHARA